VVGALLRRPAPVAIMIPPADIPALAARFERFGALAQAEQLYRQAIQDQPGNAELWAGLGRVCHALGQLDEAVSCYEQAARLRPDDPSPLVELAALLMQRGGFEAAVGWYEQVLRLWPTCVGAYSNMGLAFLALGRLEEARLSFEQALYLQPDLPEAINNLGLALLNEGRVAEARLRFERAIQLRPDLVDARNNLGLACSAEGEPDQALASFEQAVRIDPYHFGALTNLANAYQDQGRAAEAIACFRQALASRPDDAPVHSNLLLAMHYEPCADPLEILAEARRYARQHAEPLAEAIKPCPTQSPAGRRLRVGYVSADFREHPVVSFLEPIVAAHDRHRFEIFCYADVSRPDAITRRLQGYADCWRSLIGLSDLQAAERIRQDDIDILVDLAGHTGGNRLPAFARKPAPIQVSYLGYLGTTGLSAMDYYFTDAHADPPGLSEAHYQESLIRLPECGLCYAPGPAPEVRPEPPARQSGQVTFGCLNNPAKVSDEVLAVWARVLAAVPGSRLLLRTGAGRSAEERIRAAVSACGIAPERLGFAGQTATRFDYLELYHGVDIALDPFPYNGVTTTCDALWMGVPVISQAGRMNVSRQGVRFLRTVGLDELLADTLEDYVRISAALAGDRAHLAELRSGLRDRMSRSPLMDAQRLARDLEAAYVGIWENRLAARGPINR
jgi:protein O-GlcNAc transferase